MSGALINRVRNTEMSWKKEMILEHRVDAEFDLTLDSGPVLRAIERLNFKEMKGNFLAERPWKYVVVHPGSIFNLVPCNLAEFLSNNRDTTRASFMELRKHKKYPSVFLFNYAYQKNLPAQLQWPNFIKMLSSKILLIIIRLVMLTYAPCSAIVSAPQKMWAPVTTM